MTPERWRKIERLYNAALELDPDERPAYLHKVCGDDVALRQQLGVLLTWDGEPDEHLEQRSRELFSGILRPSLIGHQLGMYTITSLIGVGGMGEVYQAHDPKLGRDVAIKVLPPMVLGSAERIARFQREARMLAALNHRNIAVIHGLEQDEDAHFLVMELIPGDTLAERLDRRGRLPLKEVLEIGQQLAEALEAAHDKQIIHRDFKPSNIKVTPDGEVKVLDFGVAKSPDVDIAVTSSLPSGTSQTTATQAGVIVGTPAYMSPEQASGKPVDKRTDIWAFGCVLYEMLTALPPFRGEAADDTLGAVVDREPDWEVLPRSTPRRLRELLERCLEKDPRQRLRDIGDARLDIERLRDDPEAHEIAATHGRGATAVRTWLPRLAGVLVVAVATVIAYRTVRPTGASQETIRSEILPPDGATFGGVALSPDGRRLAFVAARNGRKQLWVLVFATATQQALAGTDGAAHPFWSADNLHLGFFADGKLKRIPASGGAPQVLADAPMGLGGTWNENGVIVYAPNSNTPLYRLPSTGGTPEPLTRLDRSEREVSHRWPAFLPGGQRLLYFALSAQAGVTGPGTSGTLFASSLDGTLNKRVLIDGYGAHYISGGYIVFARGGALVAERFRPETLSIDGQDLMTLADAVENSPSLEGPPFSVSDSGDVLVYRRRAQPGSEQRDLQWFERDGNPLGTIGTADHFWSARMSPNGRLIAAEIEDADTRATNIWIYTLARSSLPVRFTFSRSPDTAAVWSPDSQSIVFSSREQGPHFAMFRKPSNGSGREQLLLEAQGDVFAEDWSVDGRFLLYTNLDPSDKSGASIWVLPMLDGHTPHRLFYSAADDRYPHFSPNGRWVAYRSNETGRNQIYVIPFEHDGSKRQISSNGGDRPVWRPDGRELYYLSSDGELMAVGVQGDGSDVTFTAPEVLFKFSVLGGYGERLVAAADGRRFLALVSRDDPPHSLSAVIHWSAALK